MIVVDTEAMGNDIKAILNIAGRTARIKAIRATGISHGTFYRLLDGPPVKNIDTILTAAKYFGLSLKKYTRNG